MKRHALIASLLLTSALLLPGCFSSTGKPIVTYERDSSTVPAMSTADQKGLYTLFPANGLNPLAAVYLHPGDKFGFQNQDGRVVGVYIQGDQAKSVALDSILDTEYVWKFQGDKQP